jgi:hypothetical protein
MIKFAKEPKYKTLYSGARKQVLALEAEVAQLKCKIYTLSNTVLSGETDSDVVIFERDHSIVVPKDVAFWMVEYGLPWQVFRCDEHGLWITELDTSFPYHMEQSTCLKCQK